MKETLVKKYTCNYCGFMTIVHGDGVFIVAKKEYAQEHEDNCYYNPDHKKCATCVHRATSHNTNTAVCVLKTCEAENRDIGSFIPVCVEDSCRNWEINTRPAPWYDRKNTRESRHFEQNDNKNSNIYTPARYYHIAFVSNTLNKNNEHDENIMVYVSTGLTEQQARQLDDNYSQYIEDWDNGNDGDFTEFSYHDAMRSVFSLINAQYEYPEADYTIYV